MRAIPRPTPALVISLLALTVALGGTGLAASRAPASAPRTASTLATWHKLTLQNGWVYGGRYSYHVSYYKDAAGIVHLRGSLMWSGSGSGIPAFTLPRGARPKATQWIEIYTDSELPGAIEIEPNGLAFLFDNTGSDANVHTFTSIDSVSFPTN